VLLVLLFRLRNCFKKLRLARAAKAPKDKKTPMKEADSARFPNPNIADGDTEGSGSCVRMTVFLHCRQNVQDEAEPIRGMIVVGYHIV